MRRSGHCFVVPVVESRPVRRTEAMERELDELVSFERRMQRESERMDRLQRALLSAHPGNLVILVGLPPMTWMPLPFGWQTQRELRGAPQWAPVPEDVKGPVAVSADLAQAIVDGEEL